MPKQRIQEGRNWYVIRTNSEEEDKVAQNLRQRVENLELGDKIFNILVPKEKKIKIKNGQRKIVEEKLYPTYVFVDMIVTDDSWYIVRNTPGVTGFIGAGTTPIPVSSTEIETLEKKTGEVEALQYKIDLSLETLVKITDGPFKDFEGRVCEIDKEKGKIKILVNIFGRETPVQVDSLQVRKI